MHNSFYFREVSREFIEAAGIRLEAGEGFSPNPSAAAGEAIINQSMEKLMGKGSAVGKMIRSPRGLPEGQFENLVVKGVMKDYVYGEAGGQAEPVIFMCKAPEFQYFVYARPRQGIPMASALAAMEKTHHILNPGYPMVYHFVEDQYAAMYSQEMALSKIVGSFSVLAVIISCLGLFGLAAFSAERRTREVSVRKLLGAGEAGLALLLSKEFLKLIAIASLIAFPVAWWIMHEWLQSYAYRVDLSVWIFVATGSMAAALCLATVSLRTLKIIHGNLVRQLRSE
jgi:putative ABC transport system permease protein